MDCKIISFEKVGNTDLVFLLGSELCTIDYDCDFEVESTRENIRKIIKLGIGGEYEKKKLKVE